jgi:hypothetical protein
MKSAFRARLKADATVTGLVSTRIDWTKRPQGKALPAITLHRISAPRGQHFKGFHGTQMARVQVDIWADSEAELKPIEDAVLAAIVPEATQDSIHFARSFVDNVRDLGEQTETGFIHRTAIDLIVHTTAA